MFENNDLKSNFDIIDAIQIVLIKVTFIYTIIKKMNLFIG